MRDLLERLNGLCEYDAKEAQPKEASPEKASPKATYKNIAEEIDAKVEITSSTPTETKVLATVEIEKQYRPTPVAAFVPTNYRTGEYSDENLKEKYGTKRGEEIYQGLANKPGSEKGLPFVIDTKIIGEKLTMMAALKKEGDPADHHYQGLYKEWSEPARHPVPAQENKLTEEDDEVQTFYVMVMDQGGLDTIEKIQATEENKQEEAEKQLGPGPYLVFTKEELQGVADAINEVLK